MSSEVMGLDEVDRLQVALVGGKGANLWELARLDGVAVPSGFCVTTAAFRRVVAAAPTFAGLLDRLAAVAADDREAIAVTCAQIRQAVGSIVIPDDLVTAITDALARLGSDTPVAVRSSATAEDQPAASFAGLHDTYLNAVGAAAVVRHVGRCWASLFTERAVSYRVRNGIDHRQVAMAVVVQRMVPADVAGVLFTADPVTSNRTVVPIEAAPGLGDALVSGLVATDVFRVRDGRIADTQLGGAHAAPVLTEEQVLRLAALGRRIEAHFGGPQDVEWCLVADDLHIVQSRPITTLFPVPEVHDGEPHVYVSVGHQQMMTDPMKPLGLSVWQLTAIPPMHVAGGRLFVDVAERLASPTSRAAIVEGLGRSDPLMRDALRTVLAGGFVEERPDPPPPGPASGTAPTPIDADPAVVAGLIERTETSLATLQRDIADRTGTDLVDFVAADIQELKRLLADPLSMQVIMAGFDATWWLNDRLQEWLGEKNVADVLAQSAPGNVTSEMGLALLDVADQIRPHPDVVEFLRQRAGDDTILDDLPSVSGGAQAHAAIAGFLDRYGARCAGEIDITRPRWHERPGTLVPSILDNVRNFRTGEAQRRFDSGLHRAAAKERDLLARLRAMPDGAQNAGEVERMIARLRTFVGYREFPKFGIVRRYAIYKRALLAEAARQVRAGVLHDAEDVFFLTLAELREMIATGHVDDRLVRDREAAFRSYHHLTPPRVLTSDGETLSGEYHRDDVPAGALAGLAVSAGTVEGRARVILDMAQADLEPGDILVTAFTDPSWTPLFVGIAGLVTEVGGVMTHGAVIAREYGLPAVVAVTNATRLIRDGQRIRVHGTEGYVEPLP